MAGFQINKLAQCLVDEMSGRQNAKQLSVKLIKWQGGKMTT